MEIAVVGIWIGYALAVCGLAFGTRDGFETAMVGAIGAIAATVATGLVVRAFS